MVAKAWPEGSVEDGEGKRLLVRCVLGGVGG